MKKLLPVLLVIITAATYYLTPMYPVYAKTSQIQVSNPEKAKLIEKIGQDINNLNELRVNLMLDRLNVLNEDLNKLETTLNQQTSNFDVNSLRGKISDSRTAIQKAKEALDIQRQKKYVLDIPSESSAKSEVKKNRDLLFSDSMKIRELMIKAQLSVQEVSGLMLSQIKNGN